jgi:hypothetical protein
MWRSGFCRSFVRSESAVLDVWSASRKLSTKRRSGKSKKNWIIERDNVCPKPLLRKIARVQSNNEIRPTFLRACAKRIVPWVG